MHLGHACMSEEHGPTDLAAAASHAEAVGFDFAVVSDHFHPWLPRQGESPFVWGTLGAIAESTDTLEVGTSVTCPTTRIHPAIIAQAAATATVQLDGRFFLGVGTGEHLNEHVLGDRWPPFSVRLEQLEEALEVIRTLWEGGLTTHRGEHYTVENAEIFTLPAEPPPIYMSGLGPTAATAAGRIADGFIATTPDPDLVGHYEDGGGDGPQYGGMTVCWAEDENEARDVAHECWPNTAMQGVTTELANPYAFERVAEMVSPDDVADAVVLGPDPEPYHEQLRAYEAAGYDHVYIHQIGPNQEDFLEFAAEELIPAYG